ncbi:cation diffusion facilitator family transporter [Agromyces seonyuensis]|uniref:Cation diffusion facilitator family transporter n=1 Tax=Agromyces seonyuensis TaxID=2662446 RepID=A0A6I4NXL6_9MICO|nr:cation diffusion facilitator family transporter [Agromyces seonyuensis]MWB99056.1 cation diffusion facilitator family transporter [Agromyces seonyuensis]
MGHDHDHAPSASTAGNRRRIAIALGIIGVFLVVQVAGAIVSGSLALLADAGHMAGDLVGLVVALCAAAIAARPATDRQTYGYRRVEVLGALVNGILLLVVAVTVAIGAIGRLVGGAGGEAHEVSSVPMLVVASLGLLANIAAMLVLRGGREASIGVRGAYLEVLGDTIGSIAVIAAALVILATGWDPADAIASLLIAVLIAPRAIGLLRDVVHVLTESAPRETDVAEITEHLRGTAGVVEVHDVHVWQITSGLPVFTAHLVVEPDVLEGGRSGALLDRLGECLRDHFDVEHSTFQLEPAGHSEHESLGH